MFDESNSLSSTNLPDTIWLASFGGTGEKPGATTNDCCKTGTFDEEESAEGRSPAATLKSKGATEGAGGEKVETKNGTTKFGLPCIWLGASLLQEGRVKGKGLHLWHSTKKAGRRNDLAEKWRPNWLQCYC